MHGGRRKGGGGGGASDARGAGGRDEGSGGEVGEGGGRVGRLHQHVNRSCSLVYGIAMLPILVLAQLYTFMLQFKRAMHCVHAYH